MGKSKKQKKEKVDTQAWVRNMVAEFFHPIVVESSIPDAVEAAPAPLPVEEESANYCEKVACKRKSTNGCIHK